LTKKTVENKTINKPVSLVHKLQTYHSNC